MKFVKKVKAADYHRNGVGGAPFGVVLFSVDPQGDDGSDNMLGVVFPEKGFTAVFDIDLLAKGVIGFGQNSFRGDRFEPELIAALEAADSSPYPDPEDEPEEKDYEVQLAIHDYVTVTVKARSEDEAEVKAEQEALSGGETSESQGSDIEVVGVVEK